MIELLVVIAIIATLVALNLSAISAAKRRADEALCGIYKRELQVHYGDYDKESSYTEKRFMDGYVISMKCWECHPSMP
jgi:competence protein ComGC